MVAKKILFITGTRADFGKIEPLAIAAKGAGFSVGFFITGMHMLERYGATKNEVKRLGLDSYEFINQKIGDPHDVILSKTIFGLSDWLSENRPDLVVIHGDRVEALAAALVCVTNSIRCAHIEGGEVSGTIDEVYRHCNTKLCTYHFVSSEDARRRVRALGEDSERIYPIGSPELDFHGRSSGVSLEEVFNHYDIKFDCYGIVSFHPVTSEVDTMGQQARSLFDTLQRSTRSFIVISPNNDPGTNDIFGVLATLDPAQFRHIPSMRFAYFSELMKNACAIIGNSSAGVREAPFLGIPSLNMGTRQVRRSQSRSITNASCFDQQAIATFLETEWGTRYPRDFAFGLGDSANKFVSVLKTEAFWEASLQKYFSD